MRKLQSRRRTNTLRLLIRVGCTEKQRATPSFIPINAAAYGQIEALRHTKKQTGRMAKKRKRTPKSILKFPDLEQSKSAVLNSLASVSSQRSYDHGIRQFIDWYCSEPRLAFNRIVVTRYRIFLEQAHYASSTINLRLAAVRRLAYEASDAGLLSPDLAAGIRRVKGAKKHGIRVGNWLTAEQSNPCLSHSDPKSSETNAITPLSPCFSDAG